jgi:predicted PurR-regulated permease PerM
MILSVFSGIALLGFLGVVVGPVIMIIIVTTISVYNEVYHDVKMPGIEPDHEEKNQKSLWRRIASKF